MSRYFLAPRSGEKSHENYLSTIKYGVPYSRIEPFLAEEGKKILSEQEVIYAWANRAGKKSEWERMSAGDTVIFYAKGAFVMAGDVIYKQHSDQLALAMWPADDSGQPWSYTYYLTNIRYFKIPLSVFNALAGYRFVALMGFIEMSEDHKNQLLTHYKSFEDLFAAFADETSLEMPAPNERIHIRIPVDITPDVSTKTIVPYKAPETDPGKVAKKRTGYVDFDEVHKRNAKTGSVGEEIILKHEKERLTTIGRADLAAKVHQVSLKDTYAGYDIVSFDQHGNEIKIEVKATSLKQQKSFSFNMSRNEIRVAKASDNYFIYLVFSVHTERPTIHPLTNPFREESNYSLEPVSFVVKGNFAK